MVLISDLADKTDLSFVKIQLVGCDSNRSGLGAKVAVTAGEKTYTKVQDGKSGYLSQSVLPLYFGLGDAKTIDRIEVTWLGGESTAIDRPQEINQLVVLEERAD
jgi:hypothetical protein